jgi:phage regulator Rha-like protein
MKLLPSNFEAKRSIGRAMWEGRGIDASSLDMARDFGKRHAHVLRDIEEAR